MTLRISENSHIIDLMFVGDIMLGELLENVGKGVYEKIKMGIDPFEQIRNILLVSDCVIGNLECVISEESCLREPFSKTVRVGQEYTKLLYKNNINIVNVANNHTKDHGDRAFVSMINVLNKYKIKYFGYDIGYCFQTKPMIAYLKGIKIGFLGYNLANMRHEELKFLKEEILDVIKKSKREVDFLVLSVHWGMEYTCIPSIPITHMSKDFIDAGVDIIHGHHSHQLQGTVLYKGKIIAFSLGNFVSDNAREENRFTGILEIKIDREEKVIKSYKLHPLLINKNFQPEIITDNIKSIRIDTLNRIAVTSYNADNQLSMSIYNRSSRMSRRGHSKNRIWIILKVLLNPIVLYMLIKNMILYKEYKIRYGQN